MATLVVLYVHAHTDMDVGKMQQLQSLIAMIFKAQLCK